jgi:hypothetical protein
MKQALGRGGRALGIKGRAIARGTPPIPQPFEFVTASMNAAVVGQPFSQQLVASGGTAPYTWAEFGGLPDWATLNETTGLITGTPTAGSEGSSNVVILAFDAYDALAVSPSMPLVTTGTTALSITTSSLAAGTVGTPLSRTLAAANGVGALKWSITAGKPAWMSINEDTGVISGTPTAAGTVNITVRVEDSTSPTPQFAVRNLALVVNVAPVNITTADLQDAVIGSVYSFTMSASGGTSTKVWAASGLPAGLSIDSATGVISGTPSGTAGTVTGIDISVTSNGVTDTQTYSMVVESGATAGPQPFDRKFNIVQNIGNAAQMRAVAERIQNVSIGSTNRLIGFRKAFDWNAISGAGGPVNLGAYTQTLAVLADLGLKYHVGFNYVAAPFQKPLTFQGSTVLSGGQARVVWNGGVGSGLSALLGVPVGGGDWRELTIRGPGIPFVKSKSGSVSTGVPRKLVCAVPTGNEHGAGANWVGRAVSGPGIAAGTTITGVLADGFALSKDVTGNRTGFYQLGVPNLTPAAGSASSSTYLIIDPAHDSGFMGGKSGTYVVGGVNLGRNNRIPLADPAAFFDLVTDALTQLTFARAYLVELNNEPNIGMGGRPFAVPAYEYRRYCQGYVAAKKLDSRFYVLLPGTGDREDTTSNYYTAPDWNDAILDEALINQKDYLPDLCEEHNVPMPASKLPCNGAGIHPYNPQPSRTMVGASPVRPMNEIPTVSNMIAARTGVRVPMFCTEQGPEWLDDTSAPNLPSQPTNPAGGYQWISEFIDYMHGNRRWDHVVQFTGTDGATLGSTTASVTDRRAAAKRLFGPPSLFSLHDPTADDHNGVYSFNDVKKWLAGRNDVVEAWRTA